MTRAMTKEEIKQRCSMYDVLAMYGYEPDRAGFIRCPFHKEKTASFKVYKDGWKCFGCGESGDQFTFIQKMDDCSFKEALAKLGGGDGERTDAAAIRAYRAKKARERREKERQELEDRMMKNCHLAYICRRILQNWEPYSDPWCWAAKKLPWLDHEYEHLMSQRKGSH